MLFSLFVLLLTRTVVSSSITRVKRVFHGDKVEGRDTGYSSIRYYAAIGTRHGAPWATRPEGQYKRELSFVGLAENELNGEVKCGGALMTPEIVQTACHCVSKWRYYGDLSNIRPPIIEHPWENMVVVYVGVNERFTGDRSMMKVRPLVSTKFFVHSSCGKLRKGNNEMSINDFAWIRVNSTWVSGTRGYIITGLNFSPIYTEKQLRDSYANAVRRQLVCLHVGFGIFDPKFPVRGSEFLRHGWGVLMDSSTCLSKLGAGLPKRNITELATWVCTEPFRQIDQSLGKGDSGGPLTCDNQYFAVFSGTYEKSFKVIRYVDKPSDVISQYMSAHQPLVFSVFHNAIEYRTAFRYNIINFESGLSYADMIKRLKENASTTMPRRHRGRLHDEFFTSTSAKLYKSVISKCLVVFIHWNMLKTSF